MESPDSRFFVQPCSGMPRYTRTHICTCVSTRELGQCEPHRSISLEMALLERRLRQCHAGTHRPCAHTSAQSPSSLPYIHWAHTGFGLTCSTTAMCLSLTEHSGLFPWESLPLATREGWQPRGPSLYANAKPSSLHLFSQL